MYKTGHKCKYSVMLIIFKPDGNIYGIASCVCANNLHLKDEFQSYILSFLEGFAKVHIWVCSSPLYATIAFNGNYVQHVYTLYLRSVVRKGAEQCSTEENITPHDSILWWNIWENA